MKLDQLYDVQPNVARLVGGPHDGRRMTLGREWPWTWRVPMPPTWSLLDPEPDPLAMTRHPTYERTDSVDDDGVRAYRYVGDQ